MAKGEIFSKIKNPETAIKLRNILLTLAVPGTIWLLKNVITASPELMFYFNSPASAEKANYFIWNFSIPLSAAYFPFKLAEFAHLQFRRLSPSEQRPGIGERILDFLVK